jgi:hypothetical protein
MRGHQGVILASTGRRNVGALTFHMGRSRAADEQVEHRMHPSFLQAEDPKEHVHLEEGSKAVPINIYKGTTQLEAQRARYKFLVTKSGEGPKKKVIRGG